MKDEEKAEEIKPVKTHEEIKPAKNDEEELETEVDEEEEEEVDKEKIKLSIAEKLQKENALILGLSKPGPEEEPDEEELPTDPQELNAKLLGLR